jgi:hypothetical protein
MKEYTILLSGLSGTGSTSFWYAFGFHPEIKRSITKETLTRILMNKKFSQELSDIYIRKYFEPFEQTKILLDGSADSISNSDYISFLKTIKGIKRLCCVFRLRDPEKRLFSFLVSITRTFFNGFNKWRPPFIDENGELNYKELEYFIRYVLRIDKQLKTTSEILGINNIFVIKLEKLFENQKNILKFLEIDPEIKIPDIKLDTKTKIYYNEKHFKLLEEIKTWYYSNHTIFLEEVEKSNKEICNNFQVF